MSPDSVYMISMGLAGDKNIEEYSKQNGSIFKFVMWRLGKLYDLLVQSDIFISMTPICGDRP